MSQSQYRALIVDDDPAIRKLAALALGDEGFSCVTVGDGQQAMTQLHGEQFDLVVTDLAMPLKHGHSVAVELLALPARPVIAVLTGIAEPRLVKDLIARGVDDVVVKPVNFAMFAAKLKSMVGRQRDSLRNHESSLPGPIARRFTPIDISGLNEHLMGTAQILPLSCAALDVYELTSMCDVDVARIAAALERDASLVAEVLRVANSACSNRNAMRIADVEQAVLRIGQKRVGEIALATHALGAITSATVPWMNTAILSRRSIAAGVALEMLIEQGHHERISRGLLAAAVMHTLGRVVLASLYPAQYDELIAHCRTSRCALAKAEGQLLPEPHTASLARLLQFWNIPAEVFEPLSAIGRPYEQVALLSEPMRSQAELLKVAVFIGELAVGQWEPWDLLEFPSEAVLERLGISGIDQCIEQTKADLDAIARFHTTPLSAQEASVNAEQTQTERCQISCQNVNSFSGPMVAPLLASFGLRTVEPSSAVPQIVNVIGSSAAAIETHLATLPETPALLLVDQSNGAVGSQMYPSVLVPCSYAELQVACLNTSHPILPA